MDAPFDPAVLDVIVLSTGCLRVENGKNCRGFAASAKTKFLAYNNLLIRRERHPLQNY